MTLAVDITDGCDLSNEVHHELLPCCICRSLHGKRRLTSCTLLMSKTEHFSFKSGRAMQVAKLMNEDWP